MRRFDNGKLPPTFETHFNRLGYGKHLTQEQAMGRVCRYNTTPGCLNAGLPQPLPEPPPKTFLSDEERLSLAEELLATHQPTVAQPPSA